MKRFIIPISIVLINSVGYAAHITHTDYTSGGTITTSGQNANENAIVNEMNGNLDSTNLAAGGVTLTSLDSTVTAKFIPIGTILAYGASSAPSGFLICDGSAISRTTYASLYNIIGTNFGYGDNSTTFNVPDLRGRFLRGYDGGAGNDPNASSRTAMNTGGNTGDNIGSIQTSTITAHAHTLTDPGHTHNITVYGSGAIGAQANYGQGNGSTINTTVTNSATTGITMTNTGGSETRPINASVRYIIKY